MTAALKLNGCELYVGVNDHKGAQKETGRLRAVMSSASCQVFGKQAAELGTCRG